MSFLLTPELNKLSIIEIPKIPKVEASTPLTIGSALPRGPSLIPKRSPCKNTESKKCNTTANSGIISLLQILPR